jgi:hypothetical protein
MTLSSGDVIPVSKIRLQIGAPPMALRDRVRRAPLFSARCELGERGGAFRGLPGDGRCRPWVLAGSQWPCESIA